MTSLTETHPIRLSCPIRGQHAEISEADVFAALGNISPRMPGLYLRLGDADSSKWHTAQRTVDAQVRRFLGDVVSEDRIKHLSVFAIAPIPLLMALGRSLGEASTCAVYNQHRDLMGWSWGEEVPPGAELTIHRPRERAAEAVAVLMSLSARVTHENAARLMPHARWATYEIVAEEPRPNLLRTRQQLAGFRDAWRRVLAEVGDRYPGSPVYLFPALPPAAAVAVGQGDSARCHHCPRLPMAQPGSRLPIRADA